MATRTDIPRTGGFLISHAGECSFCGKRDVEVSAFAEMPHRPARICGMCLGICLDITSEYDEPEKRRSKAVQLASFEPRRALDEQMVEKLRSGNIEDVVEVMRDLGFSNVDPEQARTIVEVGARLFSEAGQIPRSCDIRARRGPSGTGDACSFCSSARAEVVKLIEGPGVTICDRCVDDASAEVLRLLSTT